MKKKNGLRKSWNEWVMNDQSLPSNKNLKRTLIFICFQQTKKSWSVWDLD